MQKKILKSINLINMDDIELRKTAFRKMLVYCRLPIHVKKMLSAVYGTSAFPKGLPNETVSVSEALEFFYEDLLHDNPNFKGLEFDAFKNESGGNAFTLSPQQWIETTGAIGIISKSGRYGGGTYAHSDIAFEFTSWIFPPFSVLFYNKYIKNLFPEEEI